MKLPLAQLVRADILKMQPYPVADATGYIKLDAMENPWRLPSEHLVELGRQLAEAQINRYPKPHPEDLKGILRDSAGIPLDAEILLGNGSDEIITLITQILARSGARLMALEPSFIMYRINAKLAQIEYVGVPLNHDFSLNLPRTLEAIAVNQPSVIFISYPNNPTGNRFARKDVMAIIDASPGLVVVDEAYSPFADDSFMNLAGTIDNLLVMRTLSKMGLAGIRLGYAAAPSTWIDELDKVRPPYNVNVLTQTAARFILLTQRAELAKQALWLREERALFAAALTHFPDVTVYPSEANFLTIAVSDSNSIFDWLKSRGILVKNLHSSHALLQNCLRITVGTPDDNQAVVDALNEYYQS